MNGDISRIPIQSLGAVVSLTDILPELPLPAPLQSGSASCALLCDPQLSADAHNCLQNASNHLSSYLCDALERACTDSIDFKDGFASDNIDLNAAPTLLSSVLLSKQHLFQNKRGFFGLAFSNQISGSLPQDSIGRPTLKINSESWQALPEFASNCRLTPNDEQSQSPTKKKKKKKKKKHKHRDGDGDTSETGGESSATTPATYDGTTPSRRFDDSGLSPTPTYGVVADTNKLSLKIFKRPVNESNTQLPTDLMSGELVKKEKKKKRKEKDREHKSKRDRRQTPATTDMEPTVVTSVELPNGTIALPTDANPCLATDVCSVSLPCPVTDDSLPMRTTMTTTSATAVVLSNAFDPLSQPVPTSVSAADLSFMSNDSLFDHLGSTQLPYRQPQSQSTSSLPSTPASTVGASRPVNTSAFPSVSAATSVTDAPPSNSLQNRAFNSQPTLFDELLNDPTMSFMDSTAISNADLTAVASTCSLPTSAANTMNMCNIMDFASHYLQSEMLSSTSPCDSFPNLGTAGEDQAAVSRTAGTLPSSPHAFNSSFMIASHLGDTLSVPPPGDHGFSISTNMLNAPGFEALSGTSPSTAFVNSFDIAALSESMGAHHVPMGLASYLAAPGQQQAAQVNTQARKPPVRTESALSTNTSTPQAWWKRKAPGSMRRKRRRKNEVEDLQSWTVKYPTAAGAATTKDAAGTERATDERTWDDAIGNYSQVLGERAKRRKRLARQTGNFDPDFVFEHDKDYHNGGESDTADGDGEAKTVDLTHDSDTGDVSVGNTSRGLRSGAAQRSYAGMDDEDEGLESVGGTDGSGRRRKKADDDEPFEVRLKEPVEARFPHLIRKSSEVTRKRRERVGFGTLLSESSGHRAHVPPSAAGEAGSLKRFLQRLQSILEAIEDTDLLQAIEAMSGANDESAKEHGSNVNKASVAMAIADNSVPSEAFIAPEDLTELCRETAKLNATRIANQIPTDQLLKLLTLLLINIRDGSSVIATLRPDEEADEHENKLWRELAMERVMRSVNAGLTGLLLMTSNDMPREVYVEDVIERTVHTVRFQLFNCIYPEFDPAYRVENAAKENQSSIKSRRARERDVHKPRAIIHLYHKLVEIVSNLAKLVKMQRLTDSLVLALSSVGVSVFFVENVSELQLAALELVTAIFAQYEPHRKLIMEEILASLARLPSSKRNLRSYRLNTEDSIQMLTALALLLVQSVIVLPAPTDPKASQTDASATTSAPTATDPNQAITDSQRADNEVLVINSYHNALRTAHTFLLVFLRKSTIKGEDDYRVIFENFVNDLLLAVNKPEWPAAEVMLSLLGSLLVQQFNNKTVDQSVRVASVDYLGTVASTLRRDAVSSQLKEKDIDAVIRDLLESSHSDDEDDENEDDDEDEVNEERKEEPNGDQKPVITQPVQETNNDNETQQSNPLNSEGVTKREEGEQNNEATETDTKPNQNGFDASSPDVKNKDLKRTPSKKNKKKPTTNTKSVDPIAQLDRVQALRDAILDYLATEDASPTAIYARKFYLAQWLNDCTKETERATQAALNRKNEGAQVNGESGSTRSGTRLSTTDEEMVLAISDRRRQHILYKIGESPDVWRQRRRFWTNTLVAPPTGRRAKQADGDPAPLIFQGTLDYEDACLVCRFLASLRPFSQSFDVYLTQICRLLSESSVAVRTKALRCLSAVVEADPNVLAREDIERAVQSRLLDTSTSVREAAVDLLGRFLGCKPELTTQYYPMLADRIRDKGVSVRKRVIRILRDICLEQPDFPRIPEICVKMIRRVNDEEGIKKLVNEVFQTMWFSPVRDKETVKLLRKVVNITDVVAACKDTGYEWFEQFLRSLLKKEEGEKVKPVEKACKQIVECLVQNIMRLEEISGQNNQRLVACLATLHLLTKIRPELMVQYTMVLQTYLRCNETSDAHVLHYVARILEVTVPLMEHPSESFVAQLEEDMVKLTLKHGKMVLESCVACLGSVVNRVSKNYSLARDCFTRFFHALQSFRVKLADDPERKIPPNIRPSILRALFTVGLLCKHFDANVFQSNKNTNVRDQVFELLMFFTEQVKSDIEMRKKALSGLGFLCTRHHELLCGSKLRDFYQHLLQTESIRTPEMEKAKVPDHQLELKCIVLENLLNFFLEEERRMLDADAKWKARQHQESLKEMGDVASGMGSCVAQTYLKDTLETFFSPFVTVRLTALSVVATILRQGLIHPVQTVPYLIAMQTDLDSNVRVKADAQLQEIDHKFPGFLSMRAIQGVYFSYRLQYVLYPETFEVVCQKAKHAASGSQSMQSPDAASKSLAPSQPNRRSARNRTVCDSDAAADANSVDSSRPSAKPFNERAAILDPESPESLFETIRGTRDPLNDIPGALNSNLYSMLRGNRGQRRSLLSGLIALFDESQTSGSRIMLSQLIYVADNLAHFPYQCQEEPLFVVHHIDLMVSMSGSGVLQSVREALFPELKAALEQALAVQAEAEAKNRAQAEMQLRTELHLQQVASAEAIAQSDHVAAEHYAEQIQETLQKLNNLAMTNPISTIGVTSSMNELRSAALVGRDTVPHIDLGPLEEEEEDADAMLMRLTAARCTALPIVRDAIRASRACVLLLTLKQYLKEVYSITDSKIQRYSPTDSPKLWERPLTRRAGVRFNPGPCLQAAGAELRRLRSNASKLAERGDTEGKETVVSSWPPVLDDMNEPGEEERFEGEMQSLVHDYLEFRKLILTIDPPGEDDLDELNTSLSAPVQPQATTETPAQTSVEQSTFQPAPVSRFRPNRTLVPQSHKSSEEDNDSDDSNAGGASRLMLAQSAPAKRRKPTTSLRTPSRTTNNRQLRQKRKRRRRLTAHGSSSGDESESAESEVSDGDY